MGGSDGEKFGCVGEGSAMKSSGTDPLRQRNLPEEVPAHHGIAPHSCGECCTTLRDIGVRYHGVPVLEEINLHLHCGELTAVIGENGAGKTTLIRCLLGEIPHQGEEIGRAHV